MAIVRRSIATGAVGPENRTDSAKFGRYCFDNFMQEPLITVKGAIAAPAGTGLTEALVFTGLNTFEYAFIGDNSEFYITLASEGGYNLAATTNTLAQGVELSFGGVKDAHPRNYTPSSEDFFARCLLIVDDASGADIVFGVKKAATTVATLTEITDLAAFRSLGDSATATGTMTILTNLNNGGTSDYTSTSISNTVSDATAIELEVRGVAGKARFLINGAPVGPSVDYTFDSGDDVCPFLRVVQTTDVAAQVKILRYESGLLDRSLQTTGDRDSRDLADMPGAAA